MIKMRHALVGLCVFFGTLVSVSSAGAEQTVIANNTENVVVAWSVKEGYKIYINIIGTDGDVIFRKNLETDVNNIQVEVLDVNQDGHDDVLVKYMDEHGFEFDVFVNVNGNSFVDSLINIPRIYVDADFIVSPDEGFLPMGKVYLEDFDFDSFPEIIVDKAYIDKKRYNKIVLKYDKDKKMYGILTKQ